jgi:hypothetical protein
MSQSIDFHDFTKTLPNPYVVTRSRLGSNTKLIDEKFICGPNQLITLHESIGEKILSFRPKKAGFQYLISFTDNTHYENNNLDALNEKLSKSSKSTEKLIMNWVIGHEYEGIENELSITVRISNPMNPFAVLQAVMSRDHTDADRLEFENGSVSVSINGATQNTAEEIFAIVTRWASACPQPQSITGINKTIKKNFGKIEFLNYWVFQILFTACAFLLLRKHASDFLQPYSFLAFVGFMFIRNASQHLNSKIRYWSDSSVKFSVFSITGGDNNQQTIITAKSKNSTIKLIFSVVFSLSLNLIAGYFCTAFPLNP